MIEAIGLMIYFLIAVFCSVLVAYPIIWLWNVIRYLNKKMFEGEKDEKD
jgi:hypothetical protein